MTRLIEYYDNGKLALNSYDTSRGWYFLRVYESYTSGELTQYGTSGESDRFRTKNMLYDAWLNNNVRLSY